MWIALINPVSGLKVRRVAEGRNVKFERNLNKYRGSAAGCIQNTQMTMHKNSM